MSERDELAHVIQGVTGVMRKEAALRYADAIIEAGWRHIFNGDCGLGGIEDPTEREAAEAWMRFANLAMDDRVGAFGAMRQMLTEFGYRKHEATR